MKTFTFNDIKEICKTHYREYLEEKDVEITFSFISHGVRRTIGFIELAEETDNGPSCTWQYLGYGMFGENKYQFNFKRIA